MPSKTHRASEIRQGARAHASENSEAAPNGAVRQGTAELVPSEAEGAVPKGAPIRGALAPEVNLSAGSTAREVQPSLLPIFVKLADRPCLVVGAGTVAASKIAVLFESGARITVVAPHANSEIQTLAATGKLQWAERAFQPDDLTGAFLAIAATSDPETNRAVFLEAQRRGVLCNSVDDPPHCDFYFSAVVRRGDLQIAVSTAGESPAVAQRFREEINEILDECIGDWLRLVGDARRRIIATHPPSEERKRLLHLLAYSEFCESEACTKPDFSPASGAAHLHLPKPESGGQE
ncbi:MAG: precorrin-2 dehydrogenase/sirohydrochlorin ferrochelatase family protein [Candidatus Acidiferrales bacterium]